MRLRGRIPGRNKECTGVAPGNNEGPQRPSHCSHATEHAMVIRLRLISPLLLLCAFVLAHCAQPQAPPHRIVGYANERIDSLNATRLTHLNYSFARIVDGEVSLGRPEQAASLRALQRVRAWNPDLKLLISVGGWGWSNGFSDAALTEQTRERFAASAVDFMKTYGLDGVDIDWEYPGQRGEDNDFRPEDKQNFTLMLRELRTRLDARSEADGRSPDDRYLLTIASGASQTFLDHTEMDKAQEYLDFVNIMTYDFHTGSSPIAGHHTNLSASTAEGSDGKNSRSAVEEHLAAGIPADKLVLGVAFYGRAWSGGPGLHLGLYEPFAEHRSVSYQVLASEYVDRNGYVRHWDTAAEAPFLWNDSLMTFISYDDPESLRLKAAYVRSRGLGGVMFWHLNHDTTGVLLGTLAEGLRAGAQ